MYIYKTTNLINGKIYIGKSTKTVSESTNYYGSGKILTRSINKNGIENFKKEIICETDNLDELNFLEKKWIKDLRSQDRNIGYNISDGGDAGDIYSTLDEESKLQYRLKSARHKEKNGRWGKGYEIIGENNPNYGNKWSDEQREKARIHFTGKKHKESSKQKISNATKGSEEALPSP